MSATGVDLHNNPQYNCFSFFPFFYSFTFIPAGFRS